MDKETKLLVLNNAVAYLKGNRIIQRDTDIGSATGYNKSTISSYLSGNHTPSDSFMEAFAKAYDLNVNEFKKIKKIKLDNSDYRAKYEDLLEKHNELLNTVIKQLSSDLASIKRSVGVSKSPLRKVR